MYLYIKVTLYDLKSQIALNAKINYSAILYKMRPGDYSSEEVEKY